MAKQKAKDSGQDPIETAFKEISKTFAKEWNKLDPEQRIDLALNVARDALANVVRLAAVSVKGQDKSEMPTVMMEVGGYIAETVADAYHDGTADTCECCPPVEVTCVIRPAGPGKLDGSSAPKGTLVN